MNMMDTIIYSAYKKQNFWLTFRSFLDTFYYAENEQKVEMIDNEPDYNVLMEKENEFNNQINEDTFYDISLKKQLSYLAAAVHKLANDYNLPVPAWVLDDKYILNEPYYFCDTKNKDYQTYLQENSLAEFKSKNIYMNSDVLSRC